MSQRRSIGWPISLGVVMIVTLVVLIVVWIVLAFGSWGILATGVLLLAVVLTGVVLYLQLSIKEIGLNQRQSNFIDSVTHELKSPIASLKLYLQTLSRRTVSEQEQADFHRFMLEDLERLDRLINHLLDAARLDQKPAPGDAADVELDALLANICETARLRYRLPPETMKLQTEPAIVRARPIDVEMVFSNLVDNAIKYSGENPRVEVSSYVNGHGFAVTHIGDNGPGIPAKLRRKIFGRFVRLGSELERSQTGTGLGLFIVRTLVNRMRGSIAVKSRSGQSGTVFEVQLPGRSPVAEAPHGAPPAAATVEPHGR